MKQFDVTVEDLRNDKNNFTSTAKFFIRKECERVNYDVNIHSFMRVLKTNENIFDDNIKKKKKKKKWKPWVRIKASIKIN